MNKKLKYKLLSCFLILSIITSTLVITPITTASAAPVAPTIYFQDDFTDGDYTTPAWTVTSGTWVISNDPKDASNKTFNQTDTGEGIITAGDTTWIDYTATMRIYTGAGQGYPGLIARVQDSKNFYYFQMQKTGNAVLSKRINGTDTTLKTVSYTMSSNTWYTLKMVLVGNSIKCYIVNNGIDKLLIDVTDTTYSSGKIGVRNKWQAVYMDDVMVTDPPAINTSIINSDSQTTSSISLNWEAVEGVTSYNIYRSTTSGSGYTYIGNSVANSFVDTGLTFDTTYYYKMAYLYGGITESQCSAEFSVNTSPAPPSTPAGLTATARNSTKVNLSWTAVTKADGYRVYRAVSGSSIEAVSGSALIYDGKSLTYSDTGLTSNTTYTYYITAYNAYGESTPISVQATTYMYDAPTNFKTASVTDTSVSLGWDAALTGTVITYNITKSTSLAGSYAQVYSGTDTTFTDSGLTQGTGYYYKITSIIDGVTSAVSDTLSIGTVRTSFTPDTVMVDTNGNAIDAHGSGIIYDEITGKYYWYGEYHVGTWPGSAVRVYSSTDLYNWTDEGNALTMIPSMDSFTNDPLISSIYAGRTDKEAIFESMRVGRIVERPKVIYNEKTHKYVMWMHMEGYTNADGSQNTSYGKAQAGVAISDSPIGPFEYIDDYRMDICPADQTDYHPSNKGMARDMNLFQDEDGTAYIIYSSEENLTTYISKLMDDYLDITGWHKDNNGNDENGVPIRDTTYKSVYGVDYVRVFPNAQREAPVMFKYNGKYYMINSGATGWAANTNKYTVADSVFGTWSTLVNPFIRTSATDPDPNLAFNSQSTYVIPVDAAKGKFIYVGDNWNGGNFSSNSGAKYIFLPINFGQGTDMTIKWYSSWTLSVLDYAASISVQTKLPETYETGSALTLPDHLQVTTNGEAISTPVTWKLNSQVLSGSVTFSSPGLNTLQAELTELNNKTITYKIYSIPKNTIYFVNAGGAKTSDYSLITSYMQDTLINKDVIDQGYNAAYASAWGYGANTASAGSTSGDIFTTLRYLAGNNSGTNAVGKDLTYTFNVPNGSYTVYTGFNDIWSNNTRKADLYINGEFKTAVTFISNMAYGNTVDVTAGTITITVRNTLYQDPMINWILITDNNATQQDSSAGLNITSGSTLSWNKVIGALSYTLYRSKTVDGTYSVVYSGSNTSFTDSILASGEKYFYKVSSTNVDSIESALSNPYTATKLPDAATFGMSVTPFLLKGEAIVSSVKLQWAQLTNATKYVVSLSQNSGEYKVLQTLSGISMDDYDLAVGTTYKYKVEAYKGDVLLDTAKSADCQAFTLPQDLKTYDNTTSSTLEVLSELKVGNTYYKFNYEKQDTGNAFKQIVQQTSTDGISYGNDKVVLSYLDHTDLIDCKFESTSIVYNNKTNKFIIWTHYENSTDYNLGRVAAAYATPGESFQFVKSFQPFGNDSRDLGFFKDEDGTAYLISSAHTNTDTILYKLTEDWLDVEKKVTTIYDDQYREAPNMIKKDGIYYLFTSQAAGWYPSTSMYSSAPSLTGPWSELRTIGSTSTFSAQSGGLVHLQGINGNKFAMMANRWMFGWKDATDAISQQRMLPISFANGFVFFDYYENVLYNGEDGTVIPVQNGRLLSQNMPVIGSTNTTTAYMANDGNYQTEWVAASSTSWPSSWTVDLGALSYLDSLQISWYMMKGSEAYYQYTVEGSADGETYTTLIDKLIGYNDYGFTVDKLTGMARYLRVTLVNAKIQNNTSNWYTPQLYEVKVFGETVTVANPVITTDPVNASGIAYNGVAKVTLSTATSGAAIYYTINNSEPDTSSTVYSNEITIINQLKAGTTITLKAIAVFAGVTSQVVEKTITFLPKPTLVPTSTPTSTPTPTPTAAPKPTPIVYTNDKDRIVVDADLLQAAASAKQDVSVVVKDSLGKELYSWNFSGSDLANSNNEMSDINLSLSVRRAEDDADINQLLTNNNRGNSANIANGIVISFDHDGVLPAPASVRIYVGDQIDSSLANNRVYVYHYNPDTNKLETLSFSSGYKVDEDGYITINLVHCSEYVILPKEADKSIITTLKNQISVSPKSKTLYVSGTKGVTTRIIVTLPSTLELVSSLIYNTSSSAIGAVTVSYRSLNKKIATVDNTGKVIAKGVGTTAIMTTLKLYSNKTITFTTKIIVKEPYIKFTNSTNSMQVGDSFTFTATAYGIELVNLVWSTTEKSILVIDEATGKATAKSSGTDFVKVKIGKFSKQIKVVVK